MLKCRHVSIANLNSQRFITELELGISSKLISNRSIFQACCRLASITKLSAPKSTRKIDRCNWDLVGSKPHGLVCVHIMHMIYNDNIYIYIIYMYICIFMLIFYIYMY